MKSKIFYMLTNRLYELKNKVYLNYIYNEILNQEWFKKACKEKKVKVVYLSKDSLINKKENIHIKINSNKVYFHRLFLVKFIYTKLENSKHVKLLNINIRNETFYKLISFLVQKQKKFLKTNFFKDLVILERKDFIKDYVKKYQSYLDPSILSKVLKCMDYVSNGIKYKLSTLINNKIYIYSLYIKEIINSDSTANSDTIISKILYEKSRIRISRRQICYVRNKYLIPKYNKNCDSNFYRLNEKHFNNKTELTRTNILKLKNNIKGIYEISLKKNSKYPFSENKIVYIGSSINLKKRLLNYTERNAHTKRIRNFLKKEHEIYFRIIKTKNYKEYEMLFINAFINICGSLPQLNSQRVLNYN